MHINNSEYSRLYKNPTTKTEKLHNFLVHVCAPIRFAIELIEQGIEKGKDIIHSLKGRVSKVDPSVARFISE